MSDAIAQDRVGFAAQLILDWATQQAIDMGHNPAALNLNHLTPEARSLAAYLEEHGALQ